MAAPIYEGASTGATDAGGNWSFTVGGLSLATVVVIQILQDGSTSGAVALTSVGSGLRDLAGTNSTLTSIGSFAIGSPTAGYQHLWIGRLDASTSPTISGTNSTSEDLYFRAYNWSGISSGTTLATVIENSTAGSTANTAGTSGTIEDAGVTTLGPDRMALNFVGINDDNAVAAFTGMSGGTWAEITAEYAEASGTDATIQLQYADLTTAGTINGGTTSNPDATDGWGVVGFALIGTTVVDTTRYPRYGFVHFNDPAIV